MLCRSTYVAEVAFGLPLKELCPLPTLGNQAFGFKFCAFNAVKTGLVLDADLVAEWVEADGGQADGGRAALGRDQGEAV